jgi:hypothetical protein
MRIRRGLLFWGLFLITAGVVPLLVRAGAVDGASLAGAWRLWPLILIALGIALVAGRSQVALVGTVVTALILGIATGGALATGNVWFGLLGDCTSGRATTNQEDQTGSFERPATVRLHLNCGTVQVSPQAGAAWALHAGFSGRPPVVVATADGLEVRSPDSGGSRNQQWDLKVPKDGLAALALDGNAGSATINLAGATLGSLNADINAFDLTVDAAEAAIQRIDVSANAGHAQITLGPSSVTGHLQANAGAIDLCVPDGVGLRFHLTDQITFGDNLDERGLSQDGETWTRPGTGLGSTIELTVEGAASSFTLNPDGGCR